MAHRIPKGETRRIDQIIVFGVTASFSIFAYVWMLIILVVTSPYRVEVWEAGATLGFIPILILSSYMAEKGWLDCLFCQNRKSGKVTVKSFIQIINSSQGERHGKWGCPVRRKGVF